MLDLNNLNGTEVAIIGMAGEFPNAENVNIFWKNLKKSSDCFTRKNNSTNFYNSTYGKLKNAYCFDNEFFNIPNDKVDELDIQFRRSIMCIYKAIGDAGYSKNNYVQNSVGLYMSYDDNCYIYDYFSKQNISNDRRFYLIREHLDTFTSKIAYIMNFDGPAFNVSYACASSMCAIHNACLGLLNYDCDMAVTGGVSIMLNQDSYELALGNNHSITGFNKSYTNNADGYVPSSASAFVVLKRLSDAIESNDNIYGVICGTALTSDGTKRAGFNAPGVYGEMSCMNKAISIAECNIDDICYIEGHGTATKLGDDIEITAIKNVFKDRNPNLPLYLGSVKNRVGHSGMASGVTELIKTIMMLKNRKILPELFYNDANSELNGTILQLSNKVIDIPKDKDFYVLLNSFGVGGLNASMVVRDFYILDTSKSYIDSKSYLFLFSARTKESLLSLIQMYIEHLKENISLPLQDIAYTLYVGRENFNFRIFVVASTLEQLLDRLLNINKDIIQSVECQDKDYKEFSFNLELAKTNLEYRMDILNTLGKRWCIGYNSSNINQLYGDNPHRVSLPVYAFKEICFDL